MKSLPLVLLCFIFSNLVNGQSKPRNIILFIGDGFGIAPKTAARMAMGQGQDNKRYQSDPQFHILALDKLRYTAMATTHSLNSWTTDSAPGATVYSTGKKIDNEVIAFDIENNAPIETILEQARKQGFAVGLVTTTRITHATPAAFASHIWHRDLEDYIAAQFISSNQKEYEAVFNASPIDSLKYSEERDWILPNYKTGVAIDVLLGGGAQHFLPLDYSLLIKEGGDKAQLKGKRKDKVNLVELAKKRGYEFVNSKEELLKINLNEFTATNNKKLLGLFKSSHNSYEQDRQLTNQWEPSLSDMTQIAIEVLKRKGGKKGFFLMVEGGRIDHLGHANAGAVSKSCKIEIDSIAFPPDGGNTRLKNTTQGDIYGSDYLIKEVLSYDYAVQEGRKLLKDKTSETLIFSTSDHECGAMALIGLHDSLKVNGTFLRTYANEPQQSEPLSAKPGWIKRGDIETGGWFPNYDIYEFQGKKYPKAASVNGRRIIIAYASNPATLGCCSGNHTPQDVWVGADDNLNGKWASKLSGQGMLDNTFLYKLMHDFLTKDGSKRKY